METPREVSRVLFGSEEGPHWISMEPSGRRLVLNSGRTFPQGFTGTAIPHGSVFSRP